MPQRPKRSLTLTIARLGSTNTVPTPKLVAKRLSEAMDSSAVSYRDQLVERRVVALARGDEESGDVG